MAVSYTHLSSFAIGRAPSYHDGIIVFCASRTIICTVRMSCNKNRYVVFIKRVSYKLPAMCRTVPVPGVMGGYVHQNHGIFGCFSFRRVQFFFQPYFLFYPVFVEESQTSISFEVRIFFIFTAVQNNEIYRSPGK